MQTMVAALHAGGALQFEPDTVAALRTVLRDAASIRRSEELLLTPPSGATVAERVTPADPQRIHTLREQALDQLAGRAAAALAVRRPEAQRCARAIGPSPTRPAAAR